MEEKFLSGEKKDKNIVEEDIETVVLNDDSLDDFKTIRYVKRKSR